MGCSVPIWNKGILITLISFLFLLEKKKTFFLSFFFSLNMDRSVLFRGTFEYEDRKKQE